MGCLRTVGRITAIHSEGWSRALVLGIKCRNLRRCAERNYGIADKRDNASIRIHPGDMRAIELIAIKGEYPLKAAHVHVTPHDVVSTQSYAGRMFLLDPRICV